MNAGYILGISFCSEGKRKRLHEFLAHPAVSWPGARVRRWVFPAGVSLTGSEL